jgi:two-component system KDP operon response regulator KdpE
VALRHGAKRGALEPANYAQGDWRVDFAARRVFVSEIEVHLTPTEYHLLAVLIRHAGRVVTHRMLLEQLGLGNNESAQHSLRVHMSQLRRKLEQEPARPCHLLTEPGVGYRLRDE